MDKQKEIEILQSLKCETYFEQFFCGADIDQMCENIRNDFPIENGCRFNQKAEILDKAMKEIAKNQSEFNKTIAYRLIDICVGDTTLIDSVLIDITSPLEIIKYKRKQGYKLSDKEIDYLINKTARFYDTER